MSNQINLCAEKAPDHCHVLYSDNAFDKKIPFTEFCAYHVCDH